MEDTKKKESELEKEELENVAGGHPFHLSCGKFKDKKACEHQAFCFWYDESCHLGFGPGPYKD